MSRILMPQQKNSKFSKNVRNSKNFSSHIIFDHLDPIEEEEGSSEINNKEKSVDNSLENVSIERIFFKEDPFRVCGYMKVNDITMALNVKMSMQFTADNWSTLVESPIICKQRNYDVIEFEVEIPSIMFQATNMDFRVCSTVINV